MQCKALLYFLEMDKTPKNHIKKRIHDLVKDRGLKAKLAKMLGFERGSISDMLKKPSDPPIHYVQAVSELTGKSVDWILTGKEAAEDDPEWLVKNTNKEQLESLEARIEKRVYYTELLKQKNENINLYKDIISLKDENLKLKTDNEDQKRIINALKSIENDYEEQIRLLQAQVRSLQTELDKFQNIKAKGN